MVDGSEDGRKCWRLFLKEGEWVKGGGGWYLNIGDCQPPDHVHGAGMLRRQKCE